MDKPDEEAPVRRRRVYRSVAEKRRIVELTLLPGASVSRVAQAEGVNSHQVFAWRRSYRRGRLGAKEERPCAWLPVVLSTAEADTGSLNSTTGNTVAADVGGASQSSLGPTGAIHIEIPGRAMVSIEPAADPALLRSILESLLR